MMSDPMMNLDARIQVSHLACDHVASLLSTKQIPPDQEESSLPGFVSDAIGNFFLALVAICHQTSPRGTPPLEGTVAGVRYRGWDYLFVKFAESARRDPRLLTPACWSGLCTDDLRRLFRDEKLGDRLSKPKRRAELLRDLGIKMTSQGWDVADQIFHHCRGFIAAGSLNLLQVLSEFQAYRDPVRKKSLFLLALMRNSGLWHYADDEALGPPVDYHEVRGHLRLGTVRITDPQLLKKVHAGREVTAEEDVAIRGAVYDAIMYISRRSALKNPSQVHYLFWNLFRSICTRKAPQCFALRPGFTIPDRYAHLVKDQGATRCPFALVCSSAGSDDPISEHSVETDYY